MAVCVNEKTGIRQARVASVAEENLDLIEKAGQGDLAAFRDFVRLYSTRIYTIAYQMIGNAEDAQDIAQEVFIRLYRSLDKFKPTSRFTTWLFRVTVNMSIDYRRRHVRHRHVSIDEAKGLPTLVGNAPPPDAGVEWKELHGAVDRLTRGLSLKQRTVFILRDLQGFTTSEIAGILGCRPSTVRVHLARARGLIRQALAVNYPGFMGGES